MIMTTTKTISMKTLFAGILLAGGSALGLTACGPTVPDSPTWKDDVRPLLLARCIRCHDNPPGPPDRPATFSMNYAEFSQIPPMSAPLGPPNYAPGPFLTMMGLAARGDSGPRRMPPPPSAALEDWQIELLDNWAVNPR
jgi:hypothetical protein